MIWLLLTAVMLGVAGVVAVRTLRMRPAAPCPGGVAYTPTADPAAAEKLAQAVRLQTVSHAQPDAQEAVAFEAFHALLTRQFPLFHARAERTVVNRLSLLYRLPAAVPCPGLDPVLITAHMDVVPVEDGTQADWTYPPFGGDVADGFVWGRGTLDTKVHLIAALEALERLLARGITPARDIYLAFGHDEELNGEQGAMHIAALLAQRGLRFALVLDEGGCVVRGVLPGVQKPIAMIGVGEKGFANLRLQARLDGGHASMPAAHTSLGVLAQALCRLEAHPCKPRLIPSTRAFLLALAPEMRGFPRVALANLWLFQGVFTRVFASSRTGSALLRTTVAVTMAQGSPAPNVVPQHATARVNCRILPGDDGDSLLRHVRRALRGLPVTVEPEVLDNPSALSPHDCDVYRTLASLASACCDGALAVPYLVMAGTDARKYESVSAHIYRFTPYILAPEDLDRIHGTNERISLENVNRCVDFFTALLQAL
ncbi:MAG: M20 family peptidase [Candidatus Limiplasma sp.]|nr:M20 family peptidase [Candidatus Limiplasma sp.]